MALSNDFMNSPGARSLGSPGGAAAGGSVGAMLGGPVGALAGSLIGTAGDAIVSGINYRQQKKMWEKTNLYNSPLEQRKRLEAAGLNPNLVYGHGSIANTSGAAPSPEYKFDSKPDIRSAAEAYTRLGADVDLKREQSENANIQNNYWMAMTEKTYNDSYLSYLKGIGEMSENARKEFLASNQGKQFAANMDYLAAKTRQSTMQGDLAFTQDRLARLNLSWLPKEKQLALQDTAASISQKHSATTLNQVYSSLAPLRFELEKAITDSNLAKNNAAIANMWKDLKIKDKSGILMDIDKQIREGVVKGQKFDNNYFVKTLKLFMPIISALLGKVESVPMVP